MSTVDWPDLADWYDKKMGDTGDFWHRTLLDPALFAQLGEVAGMETLDLACGNGHNTRRLARLGAYVTGVDFSAGVIAHNQAREAREPLGITYHVADAARLDMLADKSFDLVVCQMALMDIPDAAGAVGEAARVLRPGGRFVALFAHPCFDPPEGSAWLWERGGPTGTIWRKVWRYREPYTGRIYFRVGGEVVYVAQYHRPLAWYVNTLAAVGLVIIALEEPKPSDEFIAGDDYGAWMTQIPLHCLIEARKR